MFLAGSPSPPCGADSGPWWASANRVWSRVSERPRPCRSWALRVNGPRGALPGFSPGPARCRREPRTQGPLPHSRPRPHARSRTPHG